MIMDIKRKVKYMLGFIRCKMNHIPVKIERTEC